MRWWPGQHSQFLRCFLCKISHRILSAYSEGLLLGKLNLQKVVFDLFIRCIPCKVWYLNVILGPRSLLWISIVNHMKFIFISINVWNSLFAIFDWNSFPIIFLWNSPCSLTWTLSLIPFHGLYCLTAIANISRLTLYNNWQILAKRFIFYKQRQR